jgi:2-keto-3-deoxy-L-rhamnonate aldolase RhmA
VPWIIEASGFDYCMIDHEHGAFDLETIADLAGWFQATDVSAIVRIHKSFTHLIPAILDQGIMGIQVSEVDSVEEARAIAGVAKYPPIGQRGIAGAGMHTGYRSYGARTRPSMRRGPMPTSSSACRSNRSRAWRMSRRSRPWRAPT